MPIILFQNDIFSKIYTHLLIHQFEYFKKFRSELISETTLLSSFESVFNPVMRKIWERVLIVEMNLSDQDGLLQGTTSTERFEYFVTEVCKPDNFTALCNKYPALLPRWQQEAASYRAALETLITRATADINLIAKQFYQDETVAAITEITPIGDPHRGAQQTARLSYINREGCRRSLYYKPRNLSVDEGFYNFITWMNNHFSISHRAPRALNFGGYGWAEEIKQQDCTTKEQVSHYYQRYGSLLALTHIFAATDLHMENIVAQGEYPVIIDIETLFSALLKSDKNASAHHHIYNSLLLPVQLMHDEIEISPLTARSKMQTNIDIRINPQKRCSTLKLEPAKLVTGDCKSEVIYEGQGANFSLYRQDIIKGLRETLQFLQINRDLVLRKIFQFMNNAPIRIIIQATEEYTKILHNIFHPDTLKLNLTASVIHSIADITHDPYILQSEINNLNQGDIPYFSMPFDQAELIDGNDNKLPVAIHYAPSQKLSHQFSRLTNAFIKQSVKDLEHAFLVYHLRNSQAERSQGFNFKHIANISDEEWLDALAHDVLSKIMTNAIRHGENYSWRCINVSGGGQTGADLSNTDLYQGVAGLALAYHNVGTRTSYAPFSDFARTLSKQVIRSLDETPQVSLGAFTGTAGALWAVSVIHSYQPTLMLALIEKTLAKLSLHLACQKWENYEDLDFNSGASGTLNMLLRLNLLYREYPIAEKIKKLADFIFARILEQSDELLKEDTTLLGFAHGTSGVSACLSAYLSLFGQSNPDAIALIRRNTERETRYRQPRGWPRLNKGDACETSWCHGTVGIGLSRLYCRAFLPRETYDTDIEIVINSLGKAKNSHCLCHGLIGDYYLARAIGADSSKILKTLRKEIETDGIKTNFGLSGFEMLGAVNGMTSLFVGDALLLNHI